MKLSLPSVLEFVLLVGLEASLLANGHAQAAAIVGIIFGVLLLLANIPKIVTFAEMNEEAREREARKREQLRQLSDNMFRNYAPPHNPVRAETDAREALGLTPPDVGSGGIQPHRRVLFAVNGDGRMISVIEGLGLPEGYRVLPNQIGNIAEVGQVEPGSVLVVDGNNLTWQYPAKAPAPELEPVQKKRKLNMDD